MASVIVKVAFLLLGVLSFVFIATSLGGNYWTTVELKLGNNAIEGNAGLWKICKYVNGQGGCVTNDNDADWFKAVKAFAIMSCVAVIIGTVMAALGFFTEKANRIYTSIIFLVAAFFMIISLAVFAAKIQKSPGGSIGWAYIIGWIGVVTSGMAFVLGLVAERF